MAFNFGGFFDFVNHAYAAVQPDEDGVRRLTFHEIADVAEDFCKMKGWPTVIELPDEDKE